MAHHPAHHLLLLHLLVLPKLLLQLCLPLLGACADDSPEPEVPAASSARATSSAPPATDGDASEAPGMVYRDSYTREARPPGYREPDVIYVPTPQPVVDAMLELAGVDGSDVRPGEQGRVRSVERDGQIEIEIDAAGRTEFAMHWD